MRRLACLFALTAVAAFAAAAVGASAAGPGGSAAATLLTELPTQYRQAVKVHDGPLAARLRTEVSLLAQQPSTGPQHVATVALLKALEPTSQQLQPWPLATDIDRLAGAARAPADAPLRAGRRPYDAIRSALDAIAAGEAAGRHQQSAALALRAAVLTDALVARLGTSGTALSDALWSADARKPGVLVALQAHREAVLDGALDRARGAVTAAQQSLGDVTVSHATVVVDAAVLVFREGLEAVLILAAITASFVGAQRHLRRPVLIGGVAGIGASVVTWVIAQLLIHELGNGGLRLEAITGVLAIAVLLVITNWFFHRVYWSQWIARFNRRKSQLSKFDRVGFISGQVLALGLLGLTSVYREGFETVLFLQNLQVSAGTSACLLGAGIGLAGTLAVGAITFAMQRKLPYKKMLIATGVLIAIVLAVMTGTTVHVLQGLGWVPTSPASFSLPLWPNRWLGFYATWEGIGAQLGALAIVLGSYVVAREVQVKRPQRRARAGVAAAPTRAAG